MCPSKTSESMHIYTRVEGVEWESEGCMVILYPFPLYRCILIWGFLCIDKIRPRIRILNKKIVRMIYHHYVRRIRQLEAISILLDVNKRKGEVTTPWLVSKPRQRSYWFYIWLFILSMSYMILIYLFNLFIFISYCHSNIQTHPFSYLPLPYDNLIPQLANLLLQLKDTAAALKLINGLLGWVLSHCKISFIDVFP